MRKFISADAKNHFGELIHAARAAPVVILQFLPRKLRIASRFAALVLLL
jgi:hypothetical protein